MTPIDRLDDTTFYSVCASSICLGWIADSPEFDIDRACELTERHRAISHLIMKDWYPLTRFSRSPESCIAMQFDSPEDRDGMILIFRREEHQLTETHLAMFGLDTDSYYELSWQTLGLRRVIKGADLVSGHKFTLPQRGCAEIIVYRRIPPNVASCASS
jgi:hypothetical protein